MAPNAATGLLPVPDLEGFRLPGTDTAGRIIDEIKAIVRDPSFTGADILALMNRGLFEIAGRVRLPGLETSAELRTAAGRAFVSLPADYHRDLFAVNVAAERRRARIEPDVAALLRRFPGLDRTGSVLAVAVRGRSLYYQPVPGAQTTLTAHYYRTPDPLEAGADRISCLPPHLTAELLVGYVCREIFERIEEGLDGKKVQTTAYGERFERAVAELEAFFGPRAEAPVEVPDAMGFGRGESW
jgi:hypothetical protein